MRYNGGVDILD